MEKERYISYSAYNDAMFVDTEKSKSMDIIEVTKLLNKQNARIKELKKQIAELESTKYNLLDLSNNCWQSFIKNGEPFMTYEDVELFVKAYLNIQIEELRSKQ